MKRWLARYAEDVALLALVMIVVLGIIGLLAWGGAALWERYQQQEAAEDALIIERAVKQFHRQLCEDPRGTLADGSCEEAK